MSPLQTTLGRGEAWEKPPLMSGLVAHYVQHLRDSGFPVSKARLSVLGVQTARREMRGQLKRAWDAVASWQLQMPLQNRRPVPLDVLHGLALTLNIQASRSPHHAEKFIMAGFLVRLGFDGLMRPGEFLGLTYGDLCIPAKGSRAPFLLAVANPTNRTSMVRHQFRVIHRTGTIAWCRWLCADRGRIVALLGEILP